MVLSHQVGLNCDYWKTYVVLLDESKFSVSFTKVNEIDIIVGKFLASWPTEVGFSLGPSCSHCGISSFQLQCWRN